MRCSYCSISNVRMDTSRDSKKLDNETISSIIRYIEQDINKNKHNDNRLIFFGGEPLLVPDILNKIIKKTAHLNLKYLIYTNGSLLNQLPLEILNEMSVVFVSIDGNKLNHEKYRGINSYDLIVQNLMKLKATGKSHIIGRMTPEEDTNIYDSVINVLPLVDSVHWQLVNKPKFNDIDNFLENYKKGITSLCDFWISNLRKGEVKQIIPFQAVTSSLLANNNDKPDMFRCGALRTLQVIDIYGNIYYCDEQVGNKDRIVGHVNNGHNLKTINTNPKKFSRGCSTCNILNICRGRCWKCLSEYDDEQILGYCKLTKALVETLSNNLTTIKNIMDKNHLKIADIYKGPYYTEEIP